MKLAHVPRAACAAAMLCSAPAQLRAQAPESAAPSDQATQPALARALRSGPGLSGADMAPGRSTRSLRFEGASAEHHEPSPVRLEAGLNFGVLVGAPDSFVLGGVQTGLGFASTHFYVRGTLGLSVGSLTEQRTAFAYMLAGGYRAQPWLEVGLLAGHRIAARALLEPWLSQSWRIGIESSQRVLILDPGRWSLWLNEAISPLGERVDRAVVVDGRVFETNDRRSYALRLDLSVALRGHIF